MPRPPRLRRRPPAASTATAFRLREGARVTCAGFSVALMPDFVRYRRRLEALYGGTQRMMQPIAHVKARSAQLPPSPDTAPVAATVCDAHGGFSFRGLNPGGYYLLARVKVRSATAAGGDYVILEPVDVEPGQNTDVTLAP